MVVYFGRKSSKGISCERNTETIYRSGRDGGDHFVGVAAAATRPRYHWQWTRMAAEGRKMEESVKRIRERGPPVDFTFGGNEIDAAPRRREKLVPSKQEVPLRRRETGERVATGTE